jgi:SAM-dependent methyltransferase
MARNGPDVEKGWFSIPGIRERADRTIEEQTGGLARALAEAKGKTVLDLGCAEGAISLEFAKAGAYRVIGLEVLEPHLEVARKYCAGWPQVEFVNAHLAEWAEAHPEPDPFDMVLALGVIHKLSRMEPVLRWAAKSCTDLFCFRSGAMGEGDYMVVNKRKSDRLNLPEVMRSCGFRDEGRVMHGPKREIVHYWRRAK